MEAKSCWVRRCNSSRVGNGGYSVNGGVLTVKVVDAGGKNIVGKLTGGVLLGFGFGFGGAIECFVSVCWIGNGCVFFGV